MAARPIALPATCVVFLTLVAVLISPLPALADETIIARWDFGAEETTPLKMNGGVHRDVPGPRPPDYPDFEPNNTAVKLDGEGAYLSFDDPGVQSPFDFTTGDAITLEAWVQVSELGRRENVYVIGKGRTGSKGFARDNQNWALRVRETKGKAGVSFLFATPPKEEERNSDAHWHRWTTKNGFKPGKTWHHIAVSYRFGEPESIRGWIDGKAEVGVWDMGGPTKEAPVVDNDSIWIGSALRGAASNSFRGALDSIVIHRQIVDESAMKSRYRFTGVEVMAKPAPEVMPELGELPAGQVLVACHEGMPTHDRWLNEDETLPTETMRWQAEAMLFDRLPVRFDDWGIRDQWKAPVLARLAADIRLAPGTHRFIMRVRGLSRLWVNGVVVARAKPVAGSPSGEEPITPITPPPLPGLRSAEHRQQEVLGEATIGSDGKCRVVLETLIGGAKFRVDPGELCVAVESADGRSFLVLPTGGDPQSQQTPQTELPESPPIHLTDSDVTAALARSEGALSALDDEHRRAAAASQDSFWQKRHDAARDWARQHPAPSVPGTAASAIDAFLATKIEHALAAAAKTPLAEAQQFHEQIFSVLRDNCLRCHGEKENGGLRLDSREDALAGGDSGLAAIVAGSVADSELIRRLRSEDPDERMPPGGKPLSEEQIAALESWIASGAVWPAPPVTAEEVAAPALLDDAAFLRRLYFDTVGVPPQEDDLRRFLADDSPDKRREWIDRLLADDRWADHWMSYWQDVLAENPTLINSSLNTTGPFRWFLYDALRDGKSFDRLVTELILLRGNAHAGGSAGFGIAGDNDAPLAAKGQIVSSAFLGIELQCARCHDSPYHSTTQRDLYSLAAMLARKPVTVPKSSRVPAAFFQQKSRESLIQVTLEPDEEITPTWPFAEIAGTPTEGSLDGLMQNPGDSRERLAAYITAPQNGRFAKVVVNRIWRRLLGAGLVEPADDWEGHPASHPELLDWLANEFIAHDYDIKHMVRLILASQVYQRRATGHNAAADPELRFFVAPDRRRLSAEQVVDSLVAASGQPLDVEELTFDPDGRRPASNRLTLGVPRRAWMLADLANERDRPSLGLPRARALADLMEAFGWSGARQNPRTDREADPNVLQPGVMANSTASVLLTRAVEGSGLAELAVVATSPETLVDRLFLRYVSRLPSDAERAPLASTLAEGFAQRIVPASEVEAPASPAALPRVTWSNHLSPDASTIALELERRARSGLPADGRLRPAWREAYEDVVWSIINIREFVWLP
ncbi:MAG: DUF1553 domain-containing protein [Pirellulales bacterium]|nr:DUF1553 domain-containing protein [Pirellulales bacterium]